MRSSHCCSWSFSRGPDVGSCIDSIQFSRRCTRGGPSAQLCDGRYLKCSLTPNGIRYPNGQEGKLRKHSRGFCSRRTGFWAVRVFMKPFLLPFHPPPTAADKFYDNVKKRNKRPSCLARFSLLVRTRTYCTTWYDPLRCALQIAEHIL